MRRSLDRTDEQLAQHADEHAGPGQRDDRAADRGGAVIARRLTRGREQLTMRAQREEQTGNVDRDHDEADGEREMLDRPAVGVALLSYRRQALTADQGQ